MRLSASSSAPGVGSALGPIADERLARIRAQAGEPWARELLRHSLGNTGRPLDLDRIHAAWRFAAELDYQHPGVSAAVYLEHPQRVAALAIRLDKDIDTTTIVVALLHNVLEVTHTTTVDLSQHLGPDVADTIEALTVDRSATSEAYRERYYTRLRGGSRAGRVVKVLDKLDNLFLLNLNADDAVRDDYLREIRQWVAPLAQRELPSLSAYLADLVVDCERTGYWNPAATEPATGSSG